MKARRNQPENTPRGGIRCTLGKRQATTFAMRKHTIRFTTALLPPGILARLLARKNRLERLKTSSLMSPRLVRLPQIRRFSWLKSRP